MEQKELQDKIAEILDKVNDVHRDLDNLADEVDMYVIEPSEETKSAIVNDALTEHLQPIIDAIRRRIVLGLELPDMELLMSDLEQIIDKYII